MLARRFLDAERQRAALIVGRAGSGKSHLLAHAAERALSGSQPAILLLGQQLRAAPLWPQILHRLGVPHVSPDEFLAALDAAGEAGRCRALFLIDGLNEGPGASLWRNEIAAFFAKISEFPNVCCVMSCRTEYVEYLVPDSTLKKLPKFEARGFETPEEQERAARIYLDKRGIARPATPWLAPEFTNPLFLRSCCNALNTEGQHEFPRGLTGTKAIFSFYIESVARNLGTGRDGSDDLVAPTKLALSGIAGKMAVERRDYIARATATEIALHAFKLLPPPTDSSWLEVLQRNGLLRFDPDPNANPADPLQPPSDVVRFSFQRFQDYLMADALLAGVKSPRAGFRDGGTLSFVIEKDQVSWRWRGLVEALSTQLPERFKVELVDVLPGKSDPWWTQFQVQDAFCESVRWRGKSSFSSRTLALFNSLTYGSVDRISLLTELSVSIEHPWNAELLHRNLAKKRLAARDAFWTVSINNSDQDDSHPLTRLVDWALVAPLANVADETRRLSALVLTWTFSSSTRPLRDRATKALTKLLLVDSALFGALIKAFANVDDLYIWERLFAAAYGAACIDQSSHRLESFSRLAWTSIFAKQTPPPHMLLRDYARGLVELALHHNALPEEISVSKCRPPYASKPPKLSVTESQLEKIAEKAGGEAIARSCTSLIGDFGRYEIDTTVTRFTSTRLSDAPPLVAREVFDQFRKDIVTTAERRDALTQLQQAVTPLFAIRFRSVAGKEPQLTKQGRMMLERQVRNIQRAEQRLLGLFTQVERARYARDARHYLVGFGRSKSSKLRESNIDSAAACRWVAKRAYDLGWRRTRFPLDDNRGYGDLSRDRPSHERIGKKYQWLALDELLSRLADRFWLREASQFKTAMYDTPPDVGFLRDIDPTVLPEVEGVSALETEWIPGPRIELEETSEGKLSQWPFLKHPEKALPQLIHSKDPNDRPWTKLYEHVSVTEKYGKGHLGEHGLRQQEFRFIFTAIVGRENLEKLIKHLSDGKSIDVMRWDPPEHTDGPYLREIGWRTSNVAPQWRDDGWSTPAGLRVAFPVYEYQWESHLDASLPAGADALVVAPWLSSQLALQQSYPDGRCFTDTQGILRFFSRRVGGESSCAVIDTKLFEDYLESNGLACVWLMVAERNAWPGGSNASAAWRRSEGCCWIEDGKMKSRTWHRDQVNRPARSR
jgi:hypothetical protein